MQENQEKYHPLDARRQILIVDDEAINRELLGILLENDYDVAYAADGREAMEWIREHAATLSLVLLDLMMPIKSGWEVMAELRADEHLQHIPVIVLTADQEAEVRSLSLGAVDFIPKPYPQADVILARVRRTIELSEDRQIIQSTERDPLTGLYNREFFYRYAEQSDQRRPDISMDALVVDISHFHMINERFGTAFGDEILRRIGERLRSAVSDVGGIVCRREADTFMVYCPHGKDYKELLDSASSGLTEDELDNSRIRLRMGVYANADKTLEIERRFDRASMAADTVRGSFTKVIGLYDNTLHERELYAEQLIEDFRQAIADGQFLVHYQPKFDVRPESAELTSAEALVRWQHPRLGTISPGVFIPLFEENGLIEELDHFVWRTAADQIRDWKDRLGFSVPVSINVSRVDMYNPGLPEDLQKILAARDLTPENVYLEITESAYTEDSEQIILMASRLRSLGFRIEMDDFGTGYSSLNMLSSLPIDALKLDMQFVRNAFGKQKDTRMIELIMDIADHLGVIVIAEGVETEEQLTTLRDMGCDIVQGYYFSKPLPAQEFERFLTQRMAQRETVAEKPISERKHERPTPTKPARRESGKSRRAKTSAQSRGIPLRTIGFLFCIIASIAAAALFISDNAINRSYIYAEEANENYISAKEAASNLEAGSDYLTVRVRGFVVTGGLEYLDEYFEEVYVTRRRDAALEDLEKLLAGSDNAAVARLTMALDTSNDLMGREYQAMRLTQLAFDIPDSDVPEEVSSTALDAAYRSMTPEQMRAAAQTLVFGEEYHAYKNTIRENVRLCTEKLISSSSQIREGAAARLNRLLRVQKLLTAAMLLMVLSLVVFISVQILRPLMRMVELMRGQQSVPPTGAAELRFVTRTYNEVLEESKKTHQQLTYEASHDALTGLYNRNAYDMFIQTVDDGHIALLMVDVDKFKTINDTYGHDVGDRVLQRVAEILRQSFRSVDIICRLGGDEFVVIMTRVNSSLRQLVINKIAHANELLQNPEDDLPKTSLSVGVAFSDRENPEGDIFKDADTAQYRIKKSGGCGCCIY